MKDHDRRPELFPIAIGAYEDPGIEDLQVDVEVARLSSILAQFDVEVRDWEDAGPKGTSAILKRLRKWYTSTEPRNSFIYWTGHGFDYDGTTTLAHAESVPDDPPSDVFPEVLARALIERQGQEVYEDHWAFLIIDTCHSNIFAHEVNHLVSDKFKRRKVKWAILGTAKDDRIPLGRFNDQLELVIKNTLGSDPTVSVKRLGVEVAGRLGVNFHALHLDETTDFLQPSVSPAGMSVEVSDRLRTELRGLTPDERHHFVPKARSSDLGELTWHFTGRRAEIRQIVDWLKTSKRGMLTVTGAPGSGKSALLGYLIAQSRPRLRMLLSEWDLLTALGPAECPPDDVFDAAQLLTGATAWDVVARMASAVDDASPSAGRTLAARVTELCRRIKATEQQFTFLVDALDEAVDPMQIVREVLLPVSGIANVRIIVGTRAATEQTDLLEVLGRDDTTTVVLRHDPTALEEYVRTRTLDLVKATGLRREGVEAIIRVLKEHQHEFLYAHLLASEVRHTPDLLLPDHRMDLDDLLTRGTLQLFATAVARIAHQDESNRHLLAALATAGGKGLPLRGGVWPLVASAIADPPQRIEYGHVDALLEHAAPYILIDSEGGQTVYRLAHHSFADLFRNERPRRQGYAVVEALIADRSPGDGVNPYLRLHLASHAICSPEAWSVIGDALDVLDQLDPGYLAEYANRTGLPGLPAPVAGAWVMHRLLLNARPEDRPGLRQIGMAHLDHRPGPVTVGRWGVRWAELTPRLPSVVIGRHRVPVRAIAAVDTPTGHAVVAADDAGVIHQWPLSAEATPAEGVTLPGGAKVCAMAVLHEDGLVALGCTDGTIRFWDVRDRSLTYTVLAGHTGPVRALAVARACKGASQIVSHGDDRTMRLWDLVTPTTVWEVPSLGGVRALMVTDGPGGSRVVSGGVDGLLRRRDPATGNEVEEPIRDREGFSTMAPIRVDGLECIVSGDGKGGWQVWRPTSNEGKPRHSSPDDRGGIRALTSVRHGNGDDQVVICGESGSLHLRDLRSGIAVAELTAGEHETNRVLTTVRRAGKDDVIVSAGEDGAVRAWSLPPVTPRQRHLAGPAIAVAAVHSKLHGPIVVAGGRDGGLRRWDAVSGRAMASFPAAHQDGVAALASFDAADGEQGFVSVGSGGIMRFWEPAAGRLGPELPGFPVCRALAAVQGSGGRSHLAVGSGSAVHIVDPQRPERVRRLEGHSMTVRCLVAAEAPDGTPLVVSGGEDAVIRAWDPATGTSLGGPWAGISGWVRALSVLPGTDGSTVASGGEDGKVRFWDPISGTERTREWDVGAAVLFLTTFQEPDGNLVLMCLTDDRALWIWDPTTREARLEARLPYIVHDMSAVEGAAVLATEQGVLALVPGNPQSGR